MKRISIAVLLLLAVGLVGWETAEQKAQRIETERQEQAQAQAQKAEAERAQQAAEAARKLREELGDAIVVNVKYWAGAGANVQGSPMFGYHGTTPILPSAYKMYEQNIGFKITNPQMFVKRSNGTLTIVFDCQFHDVNKTPDHGVPIPFIIRLFDKNGQYITNFTTEERFASPQTYAFFSAAGAFRRYPSKFLKLKAEHNVFQYTINRRDVEYIQRGEFGFLVWNLKRKAATRVRKVEHRAGTNHSGATGHSREYLASSNHWKARSGEGLGLTLGSDHADSNRLALAFRVLQPCLLGSFLCRERFRQRSEFTTDVLEKQPSLDDFGHGSL
jgi:hypothetical protein